MKLRSLPRRFEVAQWDDGYRLCRLPRLGAGAWFAIEDPDNEVPFGVAMVVEPDRQPVVQLNEMAPVPQERPYDISEGYRRKLVWTLFEFMGLRPEHTESLSLLHPSIPTTTYTFDRDMLRRVQLNALKNWRGVSSEDLQPGALFPADPVRRYRAAREMTDSLLRYLSLTSHDEAAIYPRGLSDPKYAETRWQVDIDTRPYILVMAQHLGHPEQQPLWRLHRWDWSTEDDAHGWHSRRYYLSHYNLDKPGQRLRVMGTNAVGPFELLEEAGLVLLEQDLDDWIDTHIEVPTVATVVEKTLEAYDLLDRTLQAPLFAKQLDFYAWWQTLEAT